MKQYYNNTFCVLSYSVTRKPYKLCVCVCIVLDITLYVCICVYVPVYVVIISQHLNLH